MTIPIRSDFDRFKAARRGRVTGLMEKDWSYMHAVAFGGWWQVTERQRSGTGAGSTFAEFHDSGGSQKLSHWNFYMAEWMATRTIAFIGSYRVLAGHTMTIRLRDDESGVLSNEVTVTEVSLTERTLGVVLAAPFRETHKFVLEAKMSNDSETGFFINANERKQYTYLSNNP